MSSETNQWESLSMLQDALKGSLTNTKDSSQHVEVAKKAKVKSFSRELFEGGDEITEKGADLFLRCIVQPYAVKTFKARSAICGPLADCLLWFVREITEEMEGTVWSVVLRSKQYKEKNSSVKEVLKNKNRALELESESKETSVAILLELLTVDGLECGDVESILALLRWSIRCLR